jgi:hypothetical protein
MKHARSARGVGWVVLQSCSTGHVSVWRSHIEHPFDVPGGSQKLADGLMASPGWLSWTAGAFSGHA